MELHLLVTDMKHVSVKMTQVCFNEFLAYFMMSLDLCLNKKIIVG